MAASVQFSCIFSVTSGKGFCQRYEGFYKFQEARVKRERQQTADNQQNWIGDGRNRSVGIDGNGTEAKFCAAKAD